MAVKKAPVKIRRLASLAALHWIAFQHRAELWQALRNRPFGWARVFETYNEKKEDQLREFMQQAGLSAPYQRERGRYLELLQPEGAAVRLKDEIFQTLDRPPILPIYLSTNLQTYAEDREFELDAIFERKSSFAYVTDLHARVNHVAGSSYVPATRTRHISLNLKIDGRGHSADSFYGVGRHRAESILSHSMANEHAPFLLNGVARVLRGYGIPAWEIGWNFAEGHDFGSTPTEDSLRASLKREGFVVLEGSADVKRDMRLVVTHPMMQEGSKAEGLVGLESTSGLLSAGLAMAVVVIGAGMTVGRKQRNG